MTPRIPLTEESISGMAAVRQYDNGARYFMLPEYWYFVRKILHKGIRSGKVLDIGTGSGRLAIELAKVRNCNFEIVGLDISEDMIKMARENARKAGVENRIDFIVSTAAAIPYPDGYFDLVISYASLHHWFQPVSVFREAQRVAGDKGTIIIRENQRVYDNPFWRTFIWTLSRFMNKRHRDHWPGVIRACYTMPEIQEIIAETGLPNFIISSDFIRFDMCIEKPGVTV